MTRTMPSGEVPEAGSLGYRILLRIKYEATGPVNHQMIPIQVQLLCQNSQQGLAGQTSACTNREVRIINNPFERSGSMS
jgi:hypothetical protein